MTSLVLRVCSSGIVAASTLVSACTSPTGETAIRDKKCSAVLAAMSSKLAGAKSLQFEATLLETRARKSSLDVVQRSTLGGIASHPGGYKVESLSTDGRLDIIYDGREIAFIRPAGGYHSRTAASPTLDAVCYWFASHYGFTPPLAELLVNNPAAFLLDGVNRGSYEGAEVVSGVNCHHIRLRQPTLIRDLWVGVEDGLPRQIAQYRPDWKSGSPHLTTVVHRWVLNPRVSRETFKIRIPPGSRKVELGPQGLRPPP